MTNEKDFQAGFEKGRVEGVLAERARVVALIEPLAAAAHQMYLGRGRKATIISGLEREALCVELLRLIGDATSAAVLTYGEHGLEPVLGAVALVRKETP